MNCFLNWSIINLPNTSDFSDDHVSKKKKTMPRPHESGQFLNRTFLNTNLMGLPSTRNQWICTLKRHIFEIALRGGFFLDPTGLVNSCGPLKPGNFEVNSVTSSGPVLNKIKFKWRSIMFCLQFCWLFSPVFACVPLRSLLLFWRKQLAISKEDLV